MTYSARYLDPKTSRWLSTDPALGEYVPEVPVNDDARKRNGNLPGIGGVFNAVNLQLYHYAGNNPVKFTDPTGLTLLYHDINEAAKTGDKDKIKQATSQENYQRHLAISYAEWGMLKKNYNPADFFNQIEQELVKIKTSRKNRLLVDYSTGIRVMTQYAIIQKIIYDELSGDTKNLRNWLITSSFKRLTTFEYGLNPDGTINRYHHGIDYRLIDKDGNNITEGAEIKPLYNGKVIKSGYHEAMGNYIKVDIGDGVVMCYQHLNESLVKEGDIVTTDMVFAKAGNTGFSTGPHVHVDMIIPSNTVSSLKIKWTPNGKVWNYSDPLKGGR